MLGPVGAELRAGARGTTVRQLGYRADHLMVLAHSPRLEHMLGVNRPPRRSPMTRMRLATNAVWRDADGNRQEATEYHTVLSFGRLAKICAAYCAKGRRVYVEGRLRTCEYESADGLRRTSADVVAEVMQLLDRREPGSERDAAADDDGVTEPAAVLTGAGAHSPDAAPPVRPA